MQAKYSLKLNRAKGLAVAALLVLLFTGKVGLESQAVDFETNQTPIVELDSTGTDFNVTFETDVQQNGRCTPSNDPTQLSWFYKPPGDLNSVISNFDMAVLTRGDESAMRSLKSAGKSPVLQYIKWDSIHDPCGQVFKAKGTPCSCDRKPNRNNAGWEAADICNIRDNHPDWFLRDSNGNLIVVNKYVVMDPGNEGWRNFWLSRLKISQPDGWQGIFMDNMSTKFVRHGQGEIALQKYPTYDSYRNAIYSFLSNVRADYFAPNNKLMFGNVSVYWGHTPVYLKMMSYMDGSMDEHWAGTKTGYYSVKSWEDRLLRAKESLRQGNTKILVTQGSQTDLNRQRFAFATYMLVASDKTFFRYTSQNGGYGAVWLYDNYKAKLGQPLGDYTRSGNTWSRNFTNGKVSVNPETRQASIQVYNASGTCS
jgi:hypothetical protein